VDLLHGAGEHPHGPSRGGRGRGQGGATITPKELKAYLADRVPRWQLPERWSFIDEVPKTSVGKFAKTRIREAYAAGDYDVVEVQ
jgi:fatty-acyl-CoA synthase